MPMSPTTKTDRKSRSKSIVLKPSGRDEGPRQRRPLAFQRDVQAYLWRTGRDTSKLVKH